MAGWDGSGSVTRAYDWTAERDAGNNIDATKFDTENDAFASAIQNCIAKDGQNAATADLPMGGFKHTGIADGSALAHYASIGQMQNGSTIYGGTSGGTANAQTITLTPAPSAYTSGMTFVFFAGATNTGAMTLNVNGLGAKNVYYNGAAIPAGLVQASKMYVVTLSGSITTYFELVNPSIGVGASAHRDANITCGSFATTTITLNKDLYDPDELHSTVANTERITLPRVGLWVINGFIEAANAPVGSYHYISIYHNAAEVAISGNPTNKMTISAVVYAAAVTDYVDMRFWNGWTSSTTVNPARLSATFVR